MERIVGKYDVPQLAKRETENWLNQSCNEEFNIEELIAKHRVAPPNGEDSHPVSQMRYSISQLC